MTNGTIRHRTPQCDVELFLQTQMLDGREDLTMPPSPASFVFSSPRTTPSAITALPPLATVLMTLAFGAVPAH